MKFSTKFLTVLAASTVLAATVPNDEENGDDYITKEELQKMRPDVAVPAFVGITDENCSAYIEKNSGCPPHGVYADAMYYEEDCAKFESEQCQKYYTTKLVDVPDCKNVPKIDLLGFQEIFQMYYTVAKFQCEKDEKGNYCPLNPIGLQKNYNFNLNINQTLTEDEDEMKKLYTQAIKDTCGSQKCSDNYLELIKEYENDHKQFSEEAAKDKDVSEEKIKAFEDTFKREADELFKYQPIKDFKAQCDAKPSNTKPSDAKPSDAKSGASRVTYSSVLLVTIGLLLSSLY